MPVSVSQIANDEASVEMNLPQGLLTITYYPARISKKMLASLDGVDGNTLQSVLTGLDSVEDILSKLIKSWDLLEDDGSMYAITADALSLLPISFTSQVFYAIMKDIKDIGPETMASQTA